MIKAAGVRIVTADGAMLVDPERFGDLGRSAFEPDFWAARGELEAARRGRGAAWFIGPGRHPYVLRLGRRGGLIARFSKDRYLWHGEDGVRAFREFRLLSTLAARGLPVPRPLAAQYARSVLSYRCALISERIADAEPLSAVLQRERLHDATWRGVGAAVARLHAAGADHADLNAHNILLDGRGAVSVIDFDRGVLRAPGAWAARNVARLHRSLLKISRGLPAQRFTPADWNHLLVGYASPL